MDWLKNILSGVFGGPSGYNGGTPQRDDIMMFSDLNTQRTNKGLPNITPDYYASTYLPGAYKQTMGYEPGPKSTKDLMEIMNNPYLNNLYLEEGPSDVPSPHLTLY